MTFEILGSIREQRDDLRRIASSASFERLDAVTYNVSFHDDQEELVSEWADRENLQYRLVGDDYNRG